MSALCYQRVGHGSVLADFSLEVGPGEVAVVAGGRGKFALLQMALGLLAPERGAVRTLGRDPSALDAAGLRALRGRCALVPRLGALISNASLRENLELPLRYHHAVEGERALAERVEGALQTLGLTALSGLRPASLTGEEQRLAALARAVAVRPELLLMQDPFAGLGDAAADRVVAVLDQLTAGGCATLITTAITRLGTAYGGRIPALAGARIVDRSAVGSVP